MMCVGRRWSRVVRWCAHAPGVRLDKVRNPLFYFFFFCFGFVWIQMCSVVGKLLCLACASIGMLVSVRS